MSEPPKIFVSYSRRDRTWLERLQVHLSPLESDGVIDLWDDTEIKAGDDWEAEIEQALAEAKAAVLLISADYLASDFIRDRELQPLLEAAKGEGLLILSVILSPSRFKRMKSLSAFQAVNNPDRPLISLERWEQEQVFDRVAESIEKALTGVGEPDPQSAQILQSESHPEADVAVVSAPRQEQSTPHADVSPAQAALPQTCKNDLGMEFALIPAGRFDMGSNVDRIEAPVHTVTISEPFYLGVYVVTQEQWIKVMGTTPRLEPWGIDNVREGKDYPAVYVSWRDVQAFINKLNARDENSFYRLPSEAEWEYACRAGSRGAYYFGSNMHKLKAYAWYNKNTWDVGEPYAHRVGQKKPNRFGLYDMHGNVWEWVEDWYGRYTRGAVTDPKGPETGRSKVFRGGGFHSIAEEMRSASRVGDHPDLRTYYVGFRLVKEDL